MAPSDDSPQKQLTRKLYWAITSTFPKLSRADKAKTFTWAADMAERVIQRVHPSLPPAVDTNPQNGYAVQAEGRGGGRYDPSHTNGSRPLPPPSMPAWERQQAVMRERAWAHVMRGRKAGHQLPIPEAAYREVGNGRSNSPG